MRLVAALLMVLALAPAAAFAADRPRPMAHYTHQRWSEESDPPRPIFAVTQSPDGFLWVGAALAVYRFDGVGFERIETSDGGDRHGSPLTMLTTRAGRVWAYYANSGRFAVYHDGVMQLVDAPETGGTVTSLTEDRDGAIWAGLGETGRGLMRYKAGRWTRYGAAQGLPQDQLLSTVAAADGSLWVAYINSVLRLPAGGDQFETLRREPGGHARLAADPEGRIWLYDGGGVRPITGVGGRGEPPLLRHAYRPVESTLRGRMLFDPDGNLWIATRADGLRRIARPDPRGAETAARAVSAVESVRTADGLTSDAIRSVFVDHEGDVWVASEGGLDKFRPASIRVEPTLTDPASYGDILMRGRDGDVFIAQASTVYRVRPGDEPRPILTGQPQPEALCQAPDGSVWIINARAIVIWKDGRVSAGPPKIPRRSGHYGCAFDETGQTWAAGGEAGLLRLESGRWVAQDVVDGRVLMLTEDARRRLVIHHAPDRLRWATPTSRSDQRFAPGEETLEVRSIEPLPGGDLLAAGTFGLSRLAPNRPPQTIRADRLAVRGVRGLVQTADGETWLAGQTEIVRFSTAALTRAFADPDFAPPRMGLSFADGLPARVATDAWRSMVQGGDGRLWIATLSGTAWVDPKRLDRRAAPPKISIGALQVGERIHRDPRDLRLASGVRDLRIAYSMLSFADPRSVQFRYRLIGHDGDWIDPGRRREAFYTNLSPGRYRFEVIGANAEGVWNNTGAGVDFVIPPTFWQSRWFVALCLAGVAVALWLLYRLRLAQASAAIRGRLEERMRERERIARELHDTFLQSVQGLVLRFQAAADRLPPAEPARQSLDAALSRADAILGEGRSTLHDLRDASASDDLRDVLEDLAGRIGGDETPVTLRVTGDPRPVAPLVSAEATRIVREALLNATRHASADVIELTLDYGVHDLRLSVRDDGFGLPPAVVEQGRKADHYGLVGMRERADRIGGVLNVGNRPEGGVEVMLRLPWKVAAAAAPTRFPRLPWRVRGKADA